jgi:uncharacterized RDD family membrane protein YckC
MDSGEIVSDVLSGGKDDGQQEVVQVETAAVIEQEAVARAEIAGFWRRLAAYVIDLVVMGLPLLILGLLFREIFYALGPYGRFIGYAFIIFYLGYYNSEKKRGQTIGKRLTKIAVVDKNNHYLSLKKSFLRAFILGTIFILNGWELAAVFESAILRWIVTVIIFGGSFSIAYLLVFNRTTRQALHDLLVGSYVVKIPPNPAAVIPESPKIHRRIAFGLVAMVALMSTAFFLTDDLFPSVFSSSVAGEAAEMAELQSILMESGEFYTVSVARQNRTSLVNGVVLRDLNINLWSKRTCRGNPDYCDEVVDRTARLAFANFYKIEELSGMRISVDNRFDLGMAHSTRSQGAAWSIDDWLRELGVTR